MTRCRTRADGYLVAMARQIKYVVAALLLSALSVTGCSGDDDEVTSSDLADTTSSVVGQETTSTLAPTAAGEATTASPPPTAAPPQKKSAAPKASPTSPQPSPSGASTETKAEASTAEPAGDAAPTPVAPGTYTYTVTGSARSSLGSMDLPPEAHLVVHPPEGADQRQSRESQQGSQEQVLRFSADGTRLVRQTLESPQASKDFRPEPPVLTIPHPIAVNQTWAWEMRSTDGATTVKSQFTALRQEEIVIGGEPVVTWVLGAQVQTTGDVNSTIVSTIWYSPRYRLAVQTHAKANGSFSGIRFESDTTEKLVSVTPA